MTTTKCPQCSDTGKVIDKFCVGSQWRHNESRHIFVIVDRVMRPLGLSEIETFSHDLAHRMDKEKDLIDNATYLNHISLFNSQPQYLPCEECKGSGE